ncbi:hypothetical protein B2G74_22330 [Burkholderia sp. A27]|nr:hypothetical protein B2G74_22330 [Burkholderia sp. A27]
MALTDLNVRNIKPTDKQQKLFDERGLYLLVTPAGSKYWRLKYRFVGKEKSLSLGVYPEVTLKDARDRRDDARRLVAAGIDPSESRREERIARRERQDRSKGAMRFILDSDGALSFRLGARSLNLTVSETAELRRFLDATRAVISKD